MIDALRLLPRDDAGAIHVGIWQWRLARPANEIATMARLLDGEERARAERFVHARDRDSFIAGRAGLRLRLASLLGRPADAIAFGYETDGKPRLIAADGETVPAFNLSHSGDLAVLAASWHCVPGIDIEKVRSVDTGIAQRFFSRAENDALAGLEGEDLLLGFLRCWTRKEAYVKALGVGIGIDLTTFDVSLAPGKPALLEHVDENEMAASDWAMADLELPEGYLGAVAADTQARQLQLVYLERT